MIAHNSVSISSLMTVYLVSASENTSQLVHLFHICCCSMNPRPCILVSVQALISKKDSSRRIVRDFLRALSA